MSSEGSAPQSRSACRSESKCCSFSLLFHPSATVCIPCRCVFQAHSMVVRQSHTVPDVPPDTCSPHLVVDTAIPVSWPHSPCCTSLPGTIQAAAPSASVPSAVSHCPSPSAGNHASVLRVCESRLQFPLVVLSFRFQVRSSGICPPLTYFAEHNITLWVHLCCRKW